MTRAGGAATGVSAVGKVAAPIMIERGAFLLSLMLYGVNVTAAETAEPADTPPEAPFMAAPAEGVPALQLNTDYIEPSLTIGTYRPIGQMLSRGFRIAPFMLRAGIHTAIGYDDNVTLRNTNAVSSMFTVVSPSVAVGLEGALHRYYAVYRGNYGRYASSSSDNYEDHNFALTASDSWTTRLRTSVSYDYLRSHTPRGATNTNTLQPEVWYTHRARGAVFYGADGARGRIEADIGLAKRRYGNNRQINLGRDYDEIEVGTAFSYRLAPKTRAVFRVSRSDFDHPDDPSLDNVETQYSLGVVWEALAKTQGTAAVLHTSKEYSSAAQPEFSGLGFTVGAQWAPLTYSVVDIAFRRFLSEAGEAGAIFTVNNTASVAWNQLWSYSIRTSAAYLIGQLDQRGLDRKDTYHNFILKASYPLQRVVRIGAEYRRDARDSTLSTFDFTRNLILITLETAL